MITITKDELNRLELTGMSEQEIATHIGVTRQGLYLYRKRISAPQVMRSDKGTEKIPAEDKRARYNAYMNEYRRTHKAKRNQRQQRQIVLQVLGRRLKPGEVMHHIDGNPANNAHNNLVICTQSYHIGVLHGSRG